jgi:hypothetical protein
MAIELPEVLRNAPGNVRAAELVVDGLSVFCFNKTSTEKFWEIGFPRQAQHDLKITIQRLDGNGNPVGRPALHDVHQDVKRFTIRLTNGSLEHYRLFPEGGPKTIGGFNRNNPNNDPHDLRWMVDLAGTEIRHGRFDGLKPRRDDRPRSIASIRHSLFCNLKPEATPASISPVRRNDPEGNGKFDLGRTNTLIVGVLLATANGHIQFEFDPALNTIGPLEYNANKRYRIEINNEDTRTAPVKIGNFVRGDLRLFYDELIEVNGELKDHWAIPNEEVSPDGDCHPTRFGGATLLP